MGQELAKVEDKVIYTGDCSHLDVSTRSLMQKYLNQGCVYTVCDIGHSNFKLHYYRFYGELIQYFWYPYECFVLSHRSYMEKFNLK